MQHYSPLRYPGGKGRLASFVKATFAHNNLTDGIYIEPYAGGAAVALELLAEEYAWEVYINDIDPAIYAFWYSLLNLTDDLIKNIEEARLDLDEWARQKSIYQSPSSDLLELGFATFYLNRTCRSGVLNAGVIGGKSQSGDYKIDARFNTKELIQRIALIAQFKDRIILSNLDAVRFIEDVVKGMPSSALIYLDPPYYVKGSQLYKNFYRHEDHVKIADLVSDLSIPTLVTYDNVKEIQELYQGFECLEFTLQYSINNDKKRKATELLFYQNLALPYHPNFQQLVA